MTPTTLGTKPMTGRGLLVALAVASLLVIPTIASTAIVPKWQTASGENYDVMFNVDDFNGDGVSDFLTEEASGTNDRLGIRSGKTGALLAQTALAYKINDFLYEDLDGDGIPEIIIEDLNSGHYICFNVTPGSSTLAVRWTSSASFTGPAARTFVDFDGNGRLYTVLLAPGPAPSNATFWVYDRNGTLAANNTIQLLDPSLPPELHPIYATGDDHEELLIRYHTDPANSGSGSGTQVDEMWIFQSSAIAGVEPGVTGVGSVALGPSCPNPAFSLSRVEYSLPSAGPATLRLFDLSGREVRTLVAGPVPAGRHEATWDGRDAQGREVPAGTYFYELNAGGERQTRKVVRLH